MYSCQSCIYTAATLHRATPSLRGQGLSSILERRIQALASPEQLTLLPSIQRGIEKESLRITPDGRLAQTPHPTALGSALSHPYITTDYSEALLEFITPVYADIDAALGKLDDIHRFTYAGIGDELLWSASMPCILEGDDNIPVARYGDSNIARMKTVYRYGLGHRYGRLMQTIAGIHYNFSMPAAYWPLARAAEGGEEELQDYITSRYLGLVRNFRRHCWLLVYLFGASPTVCASFLRGNNRHSLLPFDSDGKSLYAPFGTALRMGDLGYSSNAQKDLDICYNSLDSYIETLRDAITRPHPEYEAIGIGEKGHEKQLNTSLLQIENEFYSPIRPKRVAHSGETPLSALRRGGIEYIEVRCIDVNPFLPLGLDAQQIRFIDSFLLYCLLSDSEPCDDEDGDRLRENMQLIVNRGREPGLKLVHADGEVTMRELATPIMAGTAMLADLLDRANGSEDYRRSQTSQQARIDDPELTPAAQILAQMETSGLPFFKLAMQASRRWAEDFRARPLAADRQAHFRQVSEQSLRKQAAVEASDKIDFETYLETYYRQYDSL